MCGNETKTEGTKSGCADSGCMPGDFKGMFNKMKQCCPDFSGKSDCTDFMKNMMGKCCAPKSDDSKTDAVHQKAEESAEKKTSCSCS